jgi:hypothetical protein
MYHCKGGPLSVSALFFVFRFGTLMPQFETVVSHTHSALDSYLLSE